MGHGLSVGSYNFLSLPDVNNRHPLWREPDLPQGIARGEHALVEIDHGLATPGAWRR